jgi:hypothetical protein
MTGWMLLLWRVTLLINLASITLNVPVSMHYAASDDPLKSLLHFALAMSNAGLVIKIIVKRIEAQS